MEVLGVFSISDYKNENLKKCRNCNEEQEINNLYCYNCGSKFTRFYALNQRRCPECGQFQYITNNFCVNCGYDFSSNSDYIMFKCPQCQNEISIDSKYCPFCYYKIEQKTCPDCNLKQNVDNEVCSNCGYDFINNVSKTVEKDQKKCPQCNKFNDIDNDICQFCGHDFLNKNNTPQHIKHKHLSKKDQFERNTIFLSNFDFNLKLCPNCNSKLFFEDIFCYNCGADVVNIKKVEDIPKKSQLSKILTFKRGVTFLSNFDFNLKLCPKCNSRLLWQDSFCYNCGEKVVDKAESVKNQKRESSKATINSDYDPTFKVGYILYLEQLRKNPEKEFSDKTAKKYNTTVSNLNQQGLDDEFIAYPSPLMIAKTFKMNVIKEILKEHNLKVSGKKDELIERLGEELSDEELRKYFKSENYHLTDKGLQFLSNNVPTLIIANNSELSKAITPSDIVKLFEEDEFNPNEFIKTVIFYLNNNINENISQNLFDDDFRNYSNALANIFQQINNLKDALMLRFNVFLLDINNYSHELNKSNPSNTKLKKKDISKLITLLNDLKVSSDDLNNLFENRIFSKTVISKEDTIKYIFKILDGDDLKIISKEINEDYSN